MNICDIKISEIARIANTSIPLISRYFKKYDDSKVTRVNNRIVGVHPEAVEEYFKHSGITYFYTPAIILIANLCGGVGKTSTTKNLAAALRRVTSRSSAIVIVDGDPQASLTTNIAGAPADDKEPGLIDFLEGKIAIDQILTNIDNNVWLIRSNLNQAFIDKVLSKPQDIKKSMVRFYQAIFEKLGEDTKILQDHNPQLATLFASSVCALNQLNDPILRAILVPLRSDKYAIQGAVKTLQEINDLTDTFSLPGNIDIHCFFSSIDKRIKSITAEALKIAKEQDEIVEHLSSAAIRYSSEIPKSIMESSNVYSSGKNNNATEDYQDLLQYVFSFDQ